MLLQDRCRHLFGGMAFHRLPDDGSLVDPPSHENDLTGVEDRSDTHGDGHPGHLRDVRELIHIR